MDVFYPYKSSLNGKILKFSLRSLSNIPHDRVFISGNLPSWIKNVVHIRQADHPGGLGAWFKLLRVCKRSNISQRFIYMNDDFLIMKPIDKIVHYHREKLSDLSMDKRAITKRMIKLGERFPDWLAFDRMHSPMVFDRDKIIKISELYNVERFFPFRTYYGNHYKIDSIYHENCKVGSWESFIEKIDQNIFISLSPRVEKNKKLISKLEERFPKKSVYEK